MKLTKQITFGSNLKHYRIRCGLTQKQLAEQIGYTEKSVSKWESGNALPTAELLVKLADIFKISLDELMFENTSHYCFLGIDGGGTKTVFKLTDDNGAVLRTVCKGTSNPNDIGMDNAMTILKEGIGEVCRGIPYSRIVMFAGLSGGGLTGDNVNVLRRFFEKFGFFAFGNESDIENLVALSDYDRCILVIMGTGFIVNTLDAGTKKRIAGWGQFFDDGGSGYTLGRDAITAALSATDGSGKPTLLTDLFQERLGETAEAHVAKFYQGGKRYIADFAELVFRAADRGDRVACGILEKNMAFVADKLNAAVKVLSEKLNTDSIPVLFSGGISKRQDILFPLIRKHMTGSACRLIRLEGEPVDGALRRAKKIFLSKTQ